MGRRRDLRIVGRPPDDLRLVILDAPYDTWKNSVTLGLFPRIVDLKLTGYRKEYPYGVIPVDTYDFVGCHHLVCRESDEGLSPLLGYKSTSLERAMIHKLPFPPMAILQAADARRHCAALKGHLDRCVEQGVGIAYDGSWTIRPDIREDRELVAFLRELLVCMNVNYHLEKGNRELVGFGMPRFKTEQFFYKFGYKPLSIDGEELPPTVMNTLQNEPAVAMHLERFTPEVLETARTHRRFWENRLVIAGEALPLSARKAA